MMKSNGRQTKEAAIIYNYHSFDTNILSRNGFQEISSKTPLNKKSDNYSELSEAGTIVPGKTKVSHNFSKEQMVLALYSLKKHKLTGTS